MTGGKFARRLVKLCIAVLLAVLVWAAAVKTVMVLRPNAGYGYGNDLSDVLTYAGAAFGGELLLLLVKRVLAGNRRKGGAQDVPPQDEGGEL